MGVKGFCIFCCGDPTCAFKLAFGPVASGALFVTTIRVQQAFFQSRNAVSQDISKGGVLVNKGCESLGASVIEFSHYALKLFSPSTIDFRPTSVDAVPVSPTKRLYATRAKRRMCFAS